MTSLPICQRLVEYNGGLINRCNFWYLTNDQPLWVKIPLACFIIVCILIFGLIILRLAIKQFVFHHKSHRPWTKKTIKYLIMELFLVLVSFGSLVLFVINLTQ